MTSTRWHLIILASARVKHLSEQKPRQQFDDEQNLEVTALESLYVE